MFKNQEFKYFLQCYFMYIFIDEQIHVFWGLAHFPQVHNQKSYWTV